MNKQSLVLLQFYQPTIMIRDVLEFILNDNELNIDAINARKDFFKKSIDADPFVRFFNSFEQGPKILRQINELYDDAYGSGKSIVVTDDGKKKANFSLRVKLLDYITGLHETLYEILKNSLKENDGKDVDPIMHELARAEDEYFRCLMALANFRVIIPHSALLNKMMSEEVNRLTENKTKPVTQEIIKAAAESKNVTQVRDILKRLVGFLTFTQQKYLAQFPEGAGVNDDIKSMYEKVVVALKFMDGTIKANNPKDIDDKIKEAQESITFNVRFYENIWKDTYQGVLDEARASQEEVKKS